MLGNYASIRRILFSGASLRLTPWTTFGLDVRIAKVEHCASEARLHVAARRMDSNYEVVAARLAVSIKLGGCHVFRPRQQSLGLLTVQRNRQNPFNWKFVSGHDRHSVNLTIANVSRSQ